MGSGAYRIGGIDNIGPCGLQKLRLFLADAGLKPTDALYQDDAESEESRPYINIFAVRADDVNNEVYKKCVEIYQTKPVLDALQEESGGTAVFADKFTTAQLQQYLTDIENDIKQH